jgi:hypothetical protein
MSIIFPKSKRHSLIIANFVFLLRYLYCERIKRIRPGLAKIYGNNLSRIYHELLPLSWLAGEDEKGRWRRQQFSAHPSRIVASGRRQGLGGGREAIIDLLNYTGRPPFQGFLYNFSSGVIQEGRRSKVSCITFRQELYRKAAVPRFPV